MNIPRARHADKVSKTLLKRSARGACELRARAPVRSADSLITALRARAEVFERRAGGEPESGELGVV